eukprot:Clim_evm1s35 gene=Clim_evmTU1s35
MGTPGWTLDAMDLILGFSNDVFDLYFAGFLPKWKITKEIAPMSLDIEKWIIDGVPDETVDPPHRGRCIIADFNPLQDRILVQLDPHRMSPNVSIQPANNGENAWILTSDGFDLCYVNRAPAEDIFGDDVNYIGSTPSDILIKMLQQNAKVVDEDLLIIDRESSNMEKMDKDYHIIDLEYYHQDSTLYMEIPSSGETPTVRGDTNPMCTTRSC